MLPLTQQEVLDKINKSESFVGIEIGDLNFSDLKFIAFIDFKGAKFKGAVDFKGTKFADAVDFRGTKFEKEANFYSATFSGDVNFSGDYEYCEVMFEKEVNFSCVTFEKEANFSYASFEKEANFSYASFIGNANFSGNDLFKGTTFKREANFSYAKFAGDANFNSAVFSNWADFSEVIFNSKADFIGVIFTGKVYFNWVTFKGKANFSKAIFEKEVNFESVMFSSCCDFSESTFEKEVNFIGKRTINYSDEEGNIDALIIHTFFRRDTLVFSPDFVTDLRNIKFQYPEKIRFNTVCFRKCLLENNISNLSKITFFDIEWPFKEKRKIIYDEIHPAHNIKNYSYLKKIYSELVNNSEEDRNFELAEDFHYGEMEMRRLSYNKLFQKFSLLSFYKYLSGYGQNVWLAFLWLLLFVLLLFPIGYLHTGIENKKTLKITEYNFSDNIQSIMAQEFWEDYWDSFGHSIAVSTLKREKLFESITTSENLFEGLQIILVSIQVALCIITIRRTFRR